MMMTIPSYEPSVQTNFIISCRVDVIFNFCDVKKLKNKDHL